MVRIEVGVAESVDGCGWVLGISNLEYRRATDRVSIYGYSGELLGHVLAVRTYSVGTCEYWVSS